MLVTGQTLYRKTLREQVYDRLYAVVNASDSYVGQCLAPVKVMAKEFGTSVHTVQLAMEQLEAEGYIQRRQGSGTFITRLAPPVKVGDQVVVAASLDSESWIELTASIMRRLYASGRLPTSIDVRHADGKALLQRVGGGPINTFIIRGGRNFPHRMLMQPAFREKQFIAVEEWASHETPPRMHQVLHDYAHGGQLLAEYLFNRGHRRVVIAGVSDALHHMSRQDDVFCGASRGRAFVDYWTAHGGTWVTLPVLDNGKTLSTIDLNFTSLLEELTGPNPATAIFGYRDVEGWTVQSLLHRYRPDLLEKVEIVGYGDTLWSRAARPALTTVAYPVEDMAQWVHKILEAESGKGDDRWSQPQRILVRPHLIDRSAQPQYTPPRSLSLENPTPALT